MFALSLGADRSPNIETLGPSHRSRRPTPLPGTSACEYQSLRTTSPSGALPSTPKMGREPNATRGGPSHDIQSHRLYDRDQLITP